MSKIKLESKVIDFIQRYSLISPEEIVVVGSQVALIQYVCFMSWQNGRKDWG